MVSFARLAELSAGNIGFSGGAAVDMMPKMGLTECVDAFSMYLYESAIADYEHEEAHCDKLFEAAMDAIAAKDMALFESAVKAMNEADDAAPAEGDTGSDNKSKSSVWEKIKSFFKKIWEFIKNISAKVKMFLDKTTKDGPTFWAKYKDQFAKSDRTVDFKGEWYDFTDANTTKSVTIADILDDLKVKALDSVSADSAKTETETISKIDKDAVTKAVKKSLGVAEDSDYAVYYYGKKTENKKVSKADQSFVTKWLLNADLKTLAKNYDAMASEAKHNMDVANASMGKDNDNGDLQTYAKAYTTVFNMLNAELNKAHSAYIKAAKAAINQAKKTVALVCMGKPTLAEEEKPEGDSNKTNESFGFDFDF